MQGSISLPLLSIQGPFCPVLYFPTRNPERSVFNVEEALEKVTLRSPASSDQISHVIINEAEAAGLSKTWTHVEFIFLQIVLRYSLKYQAPKLK